MRTVDFIEPSAIELWAFLGTSMDHILSREITARPLGADMSKRVEKMLKLNGGFAFAK